MSAPRASTDEESAPLLNHSSTPSSSQNDRSFFSALTHPTRPLTNLEKLLAGAAVFLLITTGTFVGLFAGTEVALKKERSGHGGSDGGGSGEGKWHTVTATATRTSTAPGSTVTVVPSGKPNKDVCVTPECVKLAASILESMDTEQDPCEDFYEFANGGWLKSHEIPADKGIYSAFNVVADRNKKIILKVLESIPSSASEDVGTAGDPSQEQYSADEDNKRKLKAVYNSCLDVDRLNERGLEPLLPLVKTITDMMGSFTDLPPSEKEESKLFEEEGIASGADVEIPEHVETAGIRANEARHRKPAAWPFLRADGGELEVAKKNERAKQITQALAWLHSRGVDALINFAIEGDAGGEDSQVQSLWLYQAFGGLPAKEYYEEKPILDLYTSVVTGVLTDIAEHSSHDKDAVNVENTKRDIVGSVGKVTEQGWPWPWPGDDKPDPPKPAPEPLPERMQRLAKAVVAFERDLIRAGADPEYLFNPHYAYNPYSSEKVDKALPFLHLPEYLATTGARQFPVNITVTHPPYLKAVSKIVADTPDHVLSGYFVTRLAFVHGTTLGYATGVRQELRRLQETLSGLKKGTEENRVDVCLNYVDGVVGYLAGREFVKEAFSPEAKAEGESIINSIVDAFKAKLPHVKWMDPSSAEAAKKKAEAIIPKVGYPLTPDTMNPESLQRWYAPLKVDEEDFFGTVLGATVLENQRMWGSLGRQRDRQSWEMYPQTVNAYYSPPDGEIVFPAGILQPPFYSQEWPAHLKFGAFGAVAAHELTHAFDNSGSQYDEHGRLRDWWTRNTTRAFEERAQCIARQYSKYTVVGPDGKEVHVNGNLTNGEDIADSGLAQAYAAWRHTISLKADGKDKDEHKDARLPGLDYTDEQLFFIAFARVWETLARPATAVVRVRTDPHSPPYYRVMGTLRNMKEFHEAFKCKSGSGMNPPKKDQCELW